MDKVSVKIMEEKHLEQAARILAKNFILSNPVWKHYNLSYDDIFVIMRGKLLQALAIDQSFVCIYIYPRSFMKGNKSSESPYIWICLIMLSLPQCQIILISSKNYPKLVKHFKEQSIFHKPKEVKLLLEFSESSILIMPVKAIRSDFGGNVSP